MHKFTALMILLLFTSPLFALEPLVDSVWLMDHRGEKDLFLLDIQQPANYKRFHIPGAVNAHYGLWRTDKKSAMPGMLPPVQRLEKLFGDLGIGNDATVVIIAGGGHPGEMAAASRIFWTLKVMGHEKVAILNGGLADYAKRFPRDLAKGLESATATRYKAAANGNLAADSADIQAALKSQQQLLDARTLGEYVGVFSAGANERPGTIPGAKHLPFSWLVDAQGGFRDKAATTALFNYAGLDPKRDGTIHFCHTGSRAALTWFVDYAILGHHNARLYDGSMSEWAVKKELPMETRFEF
ncbi:MAG: rhodanese-like domain-containing protein [Candidatus Thiodiazotropha sp.]